LPGNGNKKVWKIKWLSKSSHILAATSDTMLLLVMRTMQFQ